MNLKYYLRGLGIGIIVTALLMGIATRDSGQMTDEEIKERAAMLGMVEQKVLADVSNTGTGENKSEDVREETRQPTVTQEPGIQQEVEMTPNPQTPIETEAPENTQEPEITKEPEQSVVPDVTEEPAATKAPETTQEPTVTQEPTATEEPLTGASVTLVIVKGESSYSISKALVELGVITDALEFDTFLCTNRYDKSICTGTFEIPIEATYEEIAKIITKRN